MSLNNIPAPAYIALMLIAGVVLAYSAIDRWNIDNKPLVVGYLTMSLFNLFSALHRIILEYIKPFIAVARVLDMAAVLLGFIGIVSIFVGLGIKMRLKNR